jgi:hypothetical protein
MQRLKPCPFCGRVVVVKLYQSKVYGGTENDYGVECPCGARMRFEDRAKLEETWNARPGEDDILLAADGTFAELQYLHAGFLRHGHWPQALERYINAGKLRLWEVIKSGYANRVMGRHASKVDRNTPGGAAPQSGGNHV